MAEETREGEVYRVLLDKLEEARSTLGGRVFNILGKVVFEGRPLRDLLIEAVRYGEQSEVRARLHQIVDHTFDREQLQELLEERALAHNALDISRVQAIREDMERAEARRLQPHYIQSFFMEAFRLLGGTAREREPRRFELTHVPATIRNRDRLIGAGVPVQQRYERITFEKDLVNVQGQPLAAFVCPGQPLLDATLDLTLERHRDLLKQGVVLVDERDLGRKPRVLFYLEQAIQDAVTTRSGERRTISKQLLYIEIDREGHTRHIHYAPYLDYRPLQLDELDVEAVLTGSECSWITAALEQQAQTYAVAHVVPQHLAEVRARRVAWIAKTEAAVKDRLTKEISYWDHRAEALKLQEQAGKPNARLNSNEARKRADALEARLQKRMEELQLEAQISPLPPVILGGALVLPLGLLAKLKPDLSPDEGHEVGSSLTPEDTLAVAAKARAAIMAIERELGYDPIDRETEKLGYDIESRIPGTGRLRFIEVKGRVSGAQTITVTRNEILFSLNKPDDYILAIVEFDGDQATPHYVRQPFRKEPDFGVTSVNYDFSELLERSTPPC